MRDICLLTASGLTHLTHNISGLISLSSLRSGCSDILLFSSASLFSALAVDTHLVLRRSLCAEPLNGHLFPVFAPPTLRLARFVFVFLLRQLSLTRTFKSHFAEWIRRRDWPPACFMF